jgi:phage gpG-like protein
MAIVVDAKRAKKMIMGVASRIKDPAAFNKELAIKMWKEQLKHFDQSQGPRRAWPALAPSTLKFKARMGKSSKPLIFNGLLKNSMKPGVDPDGPYVVSKTEYGNYHQSDEPRTKLPQRKFMWLSDLFRKNMIDRYQAYYVDGKR